MKLNKIGDVGLLTDFELVPGMVLEICSEEIPKIDETPETLNDCFNLITYKLIDKKEI